MEYILFLTYRCNLRCPYCFAGNLLQADNAMGENTISDIKIEQICKYIENDIAINNRKNNSIVFFGGEPSLVPDIILRIIERTSYLNLNYSIYTNGLLLNNLPDILLEKLQTILIAIDGDKKSHETYKPIGSYEKAINNIKCIRNKTNAQIIGRITMEENTNIYMSVKNLLEIFDFVHWQIVNKTSFNDPQKLEKNYRIQIKKLFCEWKNALSKGIILNIIPFNQIVLSLLSENVKPSFRCGCGSSIQAIDIHGNIYLCDEYIESEKKSIGNICDNRFDLIEYKSHLDLFSDCVNCDVSSICLGRCRKCLETQPARHIRIYCNLTKVLIKMILESMDEIKNSIAKHNIDLSKFHMEIYNTEIIP